MTNLSQDSWTHYTLVIIAVLLILSGIFQYLQSYKVFGLSSY